MTIGCRTDSIAIEHEALHETAASIRASLTGACTSCGSESVCACLGDRVEDFQRRLLRHFEGEEHLWQRIDRGSLDRTTVNWLTRLVEEHERFRCRVGEVQHRLRDARPSPEVRETLAALLDDLLDHELSETRLFQRSIFEDHA